MSWGYIGDPDVILWDNNPFRADVMAALADDDTWSTVSTYLVPCVAPRGFKLPKYWPHAPQLRFCRAEFKFKTAGVSGEREMFAHIVG